MTQSTQIMTKPAEALAVMALGGIASLQTLVGFSIGPVALMRSLPWSVVGGVMASGIHKQSNLKRRDYREAIAALPEYLEDGTKQLGVDAIAPVVGQLASVTTVDKPMATFDPSDMLLRSTMIVAPSGSGKSFTLSLLMVEREKHYPSAPFKIGSTDTWGDGQTWMGLANCPRWVQENYICLGHKFESQFQKENGEPDITKAICSEIDEMVDGLYAEMLRRQRQTRDSNADQSKVSLTPQLGIIDEFPSYWAWLEDNDDKERQAKIRKILLQGRKYKIAVWVIAQSNHVNQLGLKQSDQESIYLIRPFQPGPYNPDKGNLPKHLADTINSITQRRILFWGDTKAEVQPIPHCESEPVLDWSKVIQQGDVLTWLETKIRPALKDPRAKGQSLTRLWQLITNYKEFPSGGNKRQSDENPHYARFKKIYQEELG